MHPLRVTLLAAVALGLVSYSTLPASGAEPPPVLAMYYAWFDHNSWDPARLSDLPAARYISADRATIERQVREAQSAGIDGLILNWLGPGNPTDSNLQSLLTVAGSAGFRVTADLDLDSPFIHSPADVVNSLRYLRRYFDDQAWFRYGGKPVVFFFGNRQYGVETWAQIRQQADPANSALWMGEGDSFAYLEVFDGIHPYSIAWSPDPAAQLASYAAKARSHPGKVWGATVMPGYDDTRLGRGAAGFTRPRDSGAFYRQTWEGAIATQPDMIVITSWNEWPEGSQIEPSASYGDLYLRLTRDYSDRYKAGRQLAANPVSGFHIEAAQGSGAYLVSDADGMSFWSSFQALGGVETLAGC